MKNIIITIIVIASLCAGLLFGFILGTYTTYYGLSMLFLNSNINVDISLNETLLVEAAYTIFDQNLNNDIPANAIPTDNDNSISNCTGHYSFFSGRCDI